MPAFICEYKLIMLWQTIHLRLYGAFYIFPYREHSIFFFPNPSLQTQLSAVPTWPHMTPVSSLKSFVLVLLKAHQERQECNSHPSSTLRLQHSSCGSRGVRLRALTTPYGKDPTDVNMTCCASPVASGTKGEASNTTRRKRRILDVQNCDSEHVFWS